MRIMMVRARIEALEIHVRCGVSIEERALPQLLRVDLEYLYEAQGADGISGVVDYSILLEEVAQVLEQEEFRLLETGTRRVGEHILDKFPTVWEVTVTVTKLRVPVARTVSGVSVEATFSR
jgi:dihydroneopterin aldolase